MVSWHEDLYMDEKVRSDPDKYKKMIAEASSKGFRLFPAYCVILSPNDCNLFEIISCNNFIFDYYKKKDMYIVGLSSSYKNAVNLVTEAVMDVYNGTGGFDVRQYFGTKDLIGEMKRM